MLGLEESSQDRRLTGLGVELALAPSGQCAVGHELCHGAAELADFEGDSRSAEDANPSAAV